VTNTVKQRISKIRLGEASAALTLAVVIGLGVMTTHSAQAQTFTDLHNFIGGADGATPYAGVVEDTAGNLYSTTYYGGGTSDSGTVFKISKAGKESVLYSFLGGNDGAHPTAGLVLDTKGNLYGTTPSGGTAGFGTVFKLSEKGKKTVLYNFAGGSSDGCGPNGALLRDSAGNLYGTTYSCGASSAGTVFKVSPAGKETLLHSFTGTDGGYPFLTALLMDAKGNLYGVTELGGTSSYGVLYKLSKAGKLTVLHNFTGGTSDGCLPTGTPVMDKNSNVYGTTTSCGAAPGGDGIVWKVSRKGVETVLHNFAGGPNDGAIPYAGVIIGKNGNLYGDTSQGGASLVYGTVFELNKKGELTLLHSFTGSDGGDPIGSLFQETTGNLYSTAGNSGSGEGCTISGGCGTVWKLKP
jgi:uncharacterized repeat protein (TIGR03803 family)